MVLCHWRIGSVSINARRRLNDRPRCGSTIMTDSSLRSSVFKLVLGVAAASIVSTSALAAAEEKPAKSPPLRGNDCVFFRSVYDWKELDANNLVIWAPGRRDAYHVYLTIPLYDLKFAVQ